MWESIIGFIKKLLGGSGTTLIGKDNQSISASSIGANSPVVSAGRDVHLVLHGDGAAAPKSEREELLTWLRQHGFQDPISQVMPQLLRLAQIVGHSDVEHWARLEMFGYNRDGGMRDEESVPKYRMVVGQYYDDYNRPLRVPEDLHFVNSYGLRYGVATLEEFARKTDMHNIVDPGLIELIRKDLNVHVVRFCFSPLAVVDVVNAIRNHALDKIGELEKVSP